MNLRFTEGHLPATSVLFDTRFSHLSVNIRQIYHSLNVGIRHLQVGGKIFPCGTDVSGNYLQEIVAYCEEIAKVLENGIDSCSKSANETILEKNLVF